MIGQTISHYRIMSMLGGGGMSVVYKAQDTRLGRYVALKFLLERYCRDQESLEQFQQEARTASALNHPAFCTVHDVDRHRERPFIVMEYLEGETLRDKLRRTGLTMQEAVGCAIQIAEAISLAHEAGIVHRDISPANLFVTSEGRIKLLDFGIAKCTENRVHTSAPPRSGRRRGALTGTIHYMSPEQAQGHEVDARSDIFSVGIVIYEMLAGRRPFLGQNIIAVIRRILDEPPIPLRSIVQRVPIEIEQAVNRCLEKKPERRYQTAAELRESLQLASRLSMLDVTDRVRPSHHDASLPYETLPDRTHLTGAF